MDFSVLLMYAAMIGAMWFFLFRPQRKKQQEQKTLRDGLQVGDEVVTIGGFVGKVSKVLEEEVEISVSSAGETVTLKKWAVGSKK